MKVSVHVLPQRASETPSWRVCSSSPFHSEIYEFAALARDVEYIFCIDV